MRFLYFFPSSNLFAEPDPPPDPPPPDPGTFADQLINSIMATGWTATHPHGFNEFDIIDAGDGTGDYELFFDDRIGTRYIRFHDPADLQGLIDSSSDVQIKLALHYPAVMKIAGRYYLYMYDTANNLQKLIEGNTIAELQAATVQSLGIVSPDFSPRVNPSGGYISAGQQNQAKIWTASTPQGPWTDQGFIFAPLPSGQLLQPQYATNQADGMLFYKDSKLWYLFNGLPYAHINTPSTSHQCIVEIDQSTYKAKGRAVSFIEPIDYPWMEVVNSGVTYRAIANPVYIEIQGRKEVWFMGNNEGTFSSPAPGSIARYTVSDDNTNNNCGGVNSIVRVVPGARSDKAHNCLHNFYGTVINTSGGITVNTNNSGLWNFVSTANLYKYSLQCNFIINTLPALEGVSTIFHMIGTNTPSDKCELILRVDNAGALTLTFIDYGGVATNYSAGTVTVGVAKTVTFSQVPSGAGYNFTINGGTPTYSLNGMGQSGIYSLFNDKTDLIAAANQMYGTITNFQIDLL
jgi:hypothetical protein